MVSLDSSNLSSVSGGKRCFSESEVAVDGFEGTAPDCLFDVDEASTEEFSDSLDPANTDP